MVLAGGTTAIEQNIMMEKRLNASRIEIINKINSIVLLSDTYFDIIPTLPRRITRADNDARAG